jgi:uncharacterized zinc-type alcohol dehydrogenase-like protein
VILDTVSAPHDLDALLGLPQARRHARAARRLPEPHPMPSAFSLIMGRKRIAGSLIGGIRETQEMLDFCGQHGITSDVEVIPIQRINEAYERMLRSDVRYRFSIDMASLRQ